MTDDIAVPPKRRCGSPPPLPKSPAVFDAITAVLKANGGEWPAMRRTHFGMTFDLPPGQLDVDQVLLDLWAAK